WLELRGGHSLHNPRAVCPQLIVPALLIRAPAWLRRTGAIHAAHALLPHTGGQAACDSSKAAVTARYKRRGGLSLSCGYWRILSVRQKSMAGAAGCRASHW